MGNRLPVQVIDRRYIINAILGQGGMGVVYHATDRLFNRDVALKQVLSDPSMTEFSTSYGIDDYRLALAREFKLSASLRHPNVVEVLEYGFDIDQIPYYTMEVLQSPETILSYGLQQPISVRLELVLQLLNAISYLHRRAIVHRDLKPANVLIENGQVKVLDFGLSIMRDHVRTDESIQDTMAGTLAYIAPEVLLGEKPSISSDLYAVGVMSYELIAGNHPFDLSNASVLVNQVLTEYPDTNQLDIDVDIANIFTRLLHKDPEMRFVNAQAVIDELQKHIQNISSVDRRAIRESFLQAAKLIGRDRELKQLEQGLDQAMQKQGGAWLIAGESGVGKSRLVDELRTRALVKGLLVMRGLADRMGSRPYELWLPILRWIAILLEDLSETDIEFLSRFITDLNTLINIDFPRNLSKEFKPDAIRQNIISLIQRLVQQLQRPILIILEDLHWAGDESLELLYDVVKQLESIPSLMIIASFRDDEKASLLNVLPDVPILKLQRLSTDKIAELSVAMLGEAGSHEHVVRLLERETAGNVFFVIEVVRALAEEVGQLDQIGRATLPENVFSGGIQTVLDRRINQIGLSGQELLKVASVMGRTLNITLLHAIEPNIDMERWLSDCLNAAVLEVDEGRWSFAHDKLRLGVLQKLTDDEQRDIHQQIATRMEQLYGSGTTHINSLAEHWRQAGNTEREAYYLMLSAGEELRIGLYESAINKFNRILSIIDENDSRYIDIELNIAQAHLGLGKYLVAREIYEYTLERTRNKDEELYAQILLMLGDVYVALEDLLKAHDTYQQALYIYQESSQKTGIIETLNRLGNVAYEQGNEASANEYFQESINLSRTTGDKWSMAGALNYETNSSAIDASEFEQVKGFLELSLQEYEQQSNHVGMADVLMNLGVAAEASSDYEVAESYFNRSLAIWQNLNDNEKLSEVYNHLAKLKIKQADLDDGLEISKLALGCAMKTSTHEHTYAVLLTIGDIFIQKVQLKDALRLFTFLAYAPDIPDKAHDIAERQIMELEVKLSDGVFGDAWIEGKALMLEELTAKILA